MELAGKNLRFRFGDHTILVGVATPHRFVEFVILSGFDRGVILEDNRDGYFGMGFAPALEGHFAQGLVKEASGLLALELHLDALHITVGCF